MKQWIIIGLWLGLSMEIHAQGHLINNGANIVVNNTATVNVQGAVQNSNNGTINNQGAIYLNQNWTQSGLSSAYLGSGALLFDGNTNQYLYSSTPMSIAQLSINNGNRLVLDNALTITTNLELNNNGNIALGNHQLSLAPSATITGYDATNYIITNGQGSLSQEVGNTTVHFPIGNTSYNLASLSNTGTVDVFRLRVEDQMLQNGTTGTALTEGVVNRTWMIEETTAGGSQVTLSVEWDSSEELINFVRTACGLAHYTGGAWDQSSGFGAAVGVSGSRYRLTTSGINSFSPFGVATQNVDLPVELLSFTAKRIHSNLVKLDWATATEINNQGFYIERMLETENSFETIGYVEGQGNSILQHFYALNDENPYTGVSYYRLRQVDFDGSIHYSEIRAVAGKALDTDLLVFPNPSKQYVNILLRNLSKQQKALVYLYDVHGKKVLDYTTTIQHKEAISIHNLDRFSSGIYLLHIHLEDGSFFQQKITLQ